MKRTIIFYSMYTETTKIDKLKCFFGKHDWYITGEMGGFIDVDYQCRHCGKEKRNY